MDVADQVDKVTGLHESCNLAAGFLKGLVGIEVEDDVMVVALELLDDRDEIVQELLTWVWLLLATGPE